MDRLSSPTGGLPLLTRRNFIRGLSGSLEAAAVSGTYLRCAVRRGLGHRVPATTTRTARRDSCIKHNPDAKVAFAAHDWDLMLCGHTHGGQIGIPVLARLFAPVEDKRFIAGLCPWENRQIFVTRGVGNLHHARLLCRPEVSLLNVA